MGLYLNPGNTGFQTSLRSRIYVDKTGLIRYLNELLDTEDKFVCVSRPRRFGKSMAAKMLTAYYSCGCDSREMFQNLEIGRADSFEKHLNQYDVIRLDIQLVWNMAKGEGANGQIVSYIQRPVVAELRQEYGQYLSEEDRSLAGILQKITMLTGRRFVVIIDEWDCVFREEKNNIEMQKEYVAFLRSLFKGVQAEECIHLAYLTGILPIKKYGTESALNNFDEYTMTNPGVLAKYVGFTEEEVKGLCEVYEMDFAEAKRWYDGYRFRRSTHIYNPRSIVQAMLNGEYENYWTQTETYESLRAYIDMNFDGLKDAIVYMIGGGHFEIDIGSFQNDMTSFRTKDDILTLLVHLGYLAYEKQYKEVFIPNEEVREEFVRAVRGGGWEAVAAIFENSKRLLEATLRKDEEAVAAGVEEAHLASVSTLSYNDENALSCVISLAYISARADYTLIRELPAGNGFADIVFLPHRYSDKPAIIVELKWNKTVAGAISQIKERKYVKALENYGGELLLVGINYDKANKIHQCVIEKYNK
ncbi:AAA family ATPase [Roseburia hominis]